MFTVAKILAKLSSLKNDIKDTFSEPEPPPARQPEEEKKVATPPRWKPDCTLSDAEQIARMRAAGSALRKRNKESREKILDKYPQLRKK